MNIEYEWNEEESYLHIYNADSIHTAMYIYPLKCLCTMYASSFRLEADLYGTHYQEENGKSHGMKFHFMSDPAFKMHRIKNSEYMALQPDATLPESLLSILSVAVDTLNNNADRRMSHKTNREHLIGQKYLDTAEFFKAVIDDIRTQLDERDVLIADGYVIKFPNAERLPDPLPDLPSHEEQHKALESIEYNGDFIRLDLSSPVGASAYVRPSALGMLCVVEHDAEYRIVDLALPHQPILYRTYSQAMAEGELERIIEMLN